jgi:hypothetical protein
MEDVLDTYTVTHQPALVRFGMQCGILCMRISCTLAGINISVSSSCNGCYTLQLLCHILQTDKAVFTRNVRTPYNLYVWAMENPHATHHSPFQQRFSVSVWAKIVEYYVFRLYVIEDFLSGVHYSDFLEETLSLL